MEATADAAATVETAAAALRPLQARKAAAVPKAARRGGRTCRQLGINLADNRQADRSRSRRQNFSGQQECRRKGRDGRQRWQRRTRRQRRIRHGLQRWARGERRSSGQRRNRRPGRCGRFPGPLRGHGGTGWRDLRARERRGRWRTDWDAGPRWKWWRCGAGSFPHQTRRRWRRCRGRLFLGGIHGRQRRSGWQRRAGSHPGRGLEYFRSHPSRRGPRRSGRIRCSSWKSPRRRRWLAKRQPGKRQPAVPRRRRGPGRAGGPNFVRASVDRQTGMGSERARRVHGAVQRNA